MVLELDLNLYFCDLHSDFELVLELTIQTQCSMTW